MKMFSALFGIVFTFRALGADVQVEGVRGLEEWEIRGDGKWSFSDGTIMGETGGGGHGWLCRKRPYGDFVLDLEVKCSSGNSGVQIRSHFEGMKMVGYQIEVDPSRRAWSGGLYEQGRRGWLQSLTNGEPAHTAYRVEDWNHYRIVCRGESIKSWVNGAAATDYIDSRDLSGLIALQVHAGKNVRVEFRKISIRDLGETRWKKLWDGKTMTGWHKAGGGEWEVVDGQLHGQHHASEKEFGHLVTDAIFSDFTVRLRYRAIRGNSGLYFRVEEAGFSGISGLQAEIDPEKDAGGLYETNGRNWVFQPTPEQVRRWYKRDEWNSMTVSARGERITVDLNGHQTVSIRNDPGRRKGKIALQLHGGQEVDIWVRDLEILGEPPQPESNFR